MAIPSAPLPPVSASSASTVSPASTVRRRPSPSDARSPPRTARTPSSASASSSAPSHSSAFSLRSSTAGSSDHPNLSSSAGSLHKGRASSTSRTRPPGLTITPSGTNLVLAGYPSASEVTPTSSAVATRPASTTRLPPSATAAPVANAASTNPSLLHLKTDKPALAPKVRPLPGPDDERPDIPRARCRRSSIPLLARRVRFLSIPPSRHRHPLLDNPNLRPATRFATRAPLHLHRRIAPQIPLPRIDPLPHRLNRLTILLNPPHAA
uniref:FGENESH: predicted gene_14.269 protein n=1 Tax=Rhodotorula toruloides TaxID=5286 RepID=A0A0K3CPF6_RHOTO